MHMAPYHYLLHTLHDVIFWRMRDAPACPEKWVGLCADVDEMINRSVPSHREDCDPRDVWHDARVR